MSIQSRGNSHAVKIFKKGVVIRTRSFADLAEAKEWERLENAKVILGDLEPHPAGRLTTAYVTPGGTYVKPPMLIPRNEADAYRFLSDDERGRRSRDAFEEFQRTQPVILSPRKDIPTGPTVSDLIDHYRKHEGKEKGGVVEDGHRLDQFDRLKLAKKAVADLTTKDFTDWQTHRTKVDGVKNNTANRDLTLWKLIFADAIRRKVKMPRDDYGNGFNPTAIKPLKANKPRDRRLSPAEEKILLEFAEADSVPWLHLAIRLCLEVNFRRGELLRMLVVNVDFAKHEVKLLDTKNGDERLVPLTSRAQAIVRRALDEIPRGDDGRVFPYEDRAFSMRFIRVRRMASKKIPSLADFRFHDTRHESISRMSKKTKSTVLLARSTGHKDPKTLLRYVNPTSQELSELLE